MGKMLILLCYNGSCNFGAFLAHSMVKPTMKGCDIMLYRIPFVTLTALYLFLCTMIPT